MKKLLSLFFLGVLLLTACTKAHKHTYDLTNGQWFWSETETGYSASFTALCKGCDENAEGHQLKLEATVTKKVNEPTCTADGATVYTATVEYEGKSYSDNKQIPIESTGHTYSSISVEGDYPKAYHAFDTFDDSGLTVKVVCEACGDESILSKDDYFVVYNAFGMDYLSVGDTSVTISYQGARKVLDGLTVTPITVNAPEQDSSSFVYDGEEKVYAIEESEYYTVSGNKATNAGDYDVVISLNDKTNYAWNNGSSDDLVYHFTVNKAENEIVGFEENYNTTCGAIPDFSGVSSTANDVVITYYKDSEMSEEIQLSDISEGTYYIKAISGGANYVQVVKTSTLTVNHSFECEVVDEKYLKTEATEFENAVYYKSCVCGEASTTNFFSAEGTKLPTLVANSSFSPSEVVDEDAPEGYSTVSKGDVGYADSDQGKLFLANIDISAYSSVSFAFKTGNRRLCDNNWNSPLPIGEWHYVTVSQNIDGTYTSVVKDANGNTIFSYESKVSFKDSLPYYNWDGDQPSMIWYSTEVIGIRLDPAGLFVANSSFEPSETVNEASPKGYSTVKRGNVGYTDDDQGKTFLTNLDISAYSSVSFAFKTENRRLCNDKWGSPLAIGEWFFVTITNNDNGTYTSVIKDANGTTKFGYENKNSFRESLLYYNWDGDQPSMIWYSTEVRGIIK